MASAWLIKSPNISPTFNPTPLVYIQPTLINQYLLFPHTQVIPHGPLYPCVLSPLVPIILSFIPSSYLPISAFPSHCRCT
ncbi:hypothetical protein AG1IA_04899 [Rhizoctonia solani AG-1 IA]|uniref:Uncharacterized protein n=1 Tax=Thanatephorus cucumeris (strain AG1-IA) TaxID=983506 RepID=L8WSF2_THACA|nr:hypothetical protein AG1IA_04899 [Rhizoctonia solani AG-1 IA]